MNKQEKWELIQIKKSLAELFYSECRIKGCRRKFGRGFTIHHRKYKKGEKIYKDFPNPLDYYKYLDPIVRKEPNRFSLLCRKHHHSLEMLKKYKSETLHSLLEELKLSQ